MYDAMVVGAGPIGSYVAYKLASLGHKTIVFEEHEEIGQPVRCTGIIGAECLDRFPVPDTVILGKASSAKLFAPSGEFLRLSRDTVQAYIVHRPLFDSALAAKAQEEGAQYLLSSRVKGIEISDSRVGVKVTLDGGEACFEGKTIVLANGFAPGLPQKLGLGRPGDHITGAQAEVRSQGVSEVEVYSGHKIAPGFFAWLVPVSQDRALVGLFSRQNPGQYLRNLLTSLFLQGKIATNEARISHGAIPLKPLPRTFRSRLIAVGTAAGQVKPTTGGGIYYGLLCAEIAVATLHQALSTNDFSEKLFSQYEKTWKRKLNRELRLGYYARRLYERLSDRQLDFIFKIIQERNFHESLDLSFDWHAEIILKGLRSLLPLGALFRR